MKILLLGEFSSFHQNLAEGLRALGHDAVVAGDGDGYKNIPVDINLGSNYQNFYGKVERNLKKIRFLTRIKDYDVVQLINPFFVNLHFPLLQKLQLPLLHKIYEQISVRNNKFFMTAAGSDAYYWKYANKKMLYSPIDDFLRFDIKKNKYYMQSEKAWRFNKKILNYLDGIIPITYDYQICYEGETEKLMPLIPIPINTKKYKFIDFKKKDKLHIFHGLSRYGFKGTRHIESAFKKIEKKFPNYVKTTIIGGISFNEYMKHLSNSDVVIDQVNCYSMGMNALISMAMGKIVMGGNEVESNLNIHNMENPCINVKPDSDDIVEKVEELLDKRNSLKLITQNGRKYIEKYHDNIDIAQQYLDAWQKV